MTISAIRRAAANMVGSTYTWASKLDRSALVRLMCERGIKFEKDNVTAMRNNIAAGISKDLRLRYEECMKAEASGVNTRNREMAALAAGTDYMPTVAANVGYRYTCRDEDCRLILMSEMGWLITTTD